MASTRRRHLRPVLIVLCWLGITMLPMGCTAAPEQAAAPPTPMAVPAEPSPPTADFGAIERDLRAALMSDPALLDTRAVLVSVAGETVIEYYQQRTPTEHAHVWSVTKTVISILVGIAVDEGRLRFDRTLAELLPEHTASMTDTQKTVTLKQLLTMTGGFPDGGLNFEAPDTVAQILTFGLASDPGASFVYSDSSAHLVAAVLRRAIDRPILDYAREKLFDPLGIDTRPAWQDWDTGSTSGFEEADFAWAVDGSGINIGAFGLKLTAPDLVKLGELYLNEGRWQGQQIVSSAWVRESTTQQLTPEQQTGEGPYGYFWWVGPVGEHAAFEASGRNYQSILVVPDRKLVRVVTASVDRPHDDLHLSLGPVLEQVFEPLMS